MNKIEVIINKLRNISFDCYAKKRYETMICSLRAYCYASFKYNQIYTDEAIESLLCKYSTCFSNRVNIDKANANTILFYDGFGADTRGLHLIYLKALVELNYNVVYVTTFSAAHRQNEVKQILKHSGKILYFTKNGTQKIDELINIFNTEKPGIAFYYTAPDDIEGAVVFSIFKGVIKRFQINLTDHTFWIGKCAFDYCIEFREYGANISHFYRKIGRERIAILPYYPWTNNNIDFEGFSFIKNFNQNNYKIIFSGGHLYKTIDRRMTYYKMVYKILLHNSESVFIYAGEGDDRGLRWLSKRFVDRVYHIKERNDLLQVMKHSYVYLNTYPMIGGLMMQYACIAGIPPLTLYDNGTEDHKGILINEDDLPLYYNSVESLVAEADKLLQNEEYYINRCEQLKNCIVGENEFKNGLKEIINGNIKLKSQFHRVNTEKFRKDFKYRIKLSDLDEIIARFSNIKLIKFFPKSFLKEFCRKISTSIKNRC